MITTAINWSLAKCSCPSWNSSTDESALRSALASLDDCGSSLHASLRHWTWLVVLGVVLEVVFVVWEYFEERHDFNRGIVHPPERPARLLFVLGLLGAALVASGVAGELFAESQIETVETCIRQGNDALSLLLSKEAGDAAKSAKTAREESTAAKTEADAAKLSAGEALTRAHAAGSSADKAQKKVAAVSERADDIEERLKLALSMLSVRSVRHPTGMKDALTLYKWPQIVIRSYSGDPEAWSACIERDLSAGT